MFWIRIRVTCFICYDNLFLFYFVFWHRVETYCPFIQSFKRPFTFTFYPKGSPSKLTFYQESFDVYLTISETFTCVHTNKTWFDRIYRSFVNLLFFSVMYPFRRPSFRSHSLSRPRGNSKLLSVKFSSRFWDWVIQSHKSPLLEWLLLCWLEVLYLRMIRRTNRFIKSNNVKKGQRVFVHLSIPRKRNHTFSYPITLYLTRDDEDTNVHKRRYQR